MNKLRGEPTNDKWAWAVRIGLTVLGAALIFGVTYVAEKAVNSVDATEVEKIVDAEIALSPMMTPAAQKEIGKLIIDSEVNKEQHKQILVGLDKIEQDIRELNETMKEIEKEIKK